MGRLFVLFSENCDSLDVQFSAGTKYANGDFSSISNKHFFDFALLCLTRGKSSVDQDKACFEAYCQRRQMNIAWFGSVPKRVIFKCLTSLSDATQVPPPYDMIIKVRLIKMEISND